MVNKLFNIKDDGILVTKNKVTTWSYKKYPPKSKYYLLENLNVFSLVIFIIVLCNISIFILNKGLTVTLFYSNILFLFTIITLIYIIIHEWKHGKYWN